jgi:hypothetical protein
MADSSVVFKEEVIPASAVKLTGNSSMPVCPKCGKQDLVLHGNMSFPHREIAVAGMIEETSTDWETKQPFELTQFDCVPCSIRYVIRSDESFALHREVANLREMIVKVTGKDPYGAAQC